MIRDSVVLVALGVLAVLVVALAVVLLRTRARTRRELDAARTESARLRAQVDGIERTLASSTPAPPRPSAEYTITGLGAPVEPEPPTHIDQALFADLVLRETVVKAASLAHGVRRALSPASRNRIRFEVRREIRRSRKQRRSDLRGARRNWDARQRAGLTDDEDAA